ncbi:MAG: hypothetical protein WCT27_05070 [Patescibacteria group bacterium]|jgi:hypothetical protein
MKSQKGFVPIVIAALIAVLAIGFTVTAVVYESKKSEETKTNINTVTNINIAVVNENINAVVNTNTVVVNGNSNTNSDATAEWKTYTNDQYSYGMRYPSDWKVRENEAPYGNNLGHQTLLYTDAVPNNPSESNVLSKFYVDIFSKSGNETAEEGYRRVTTNDISGLQKEQVNIDGASAFYYKSIPSFAGNNAVVVIYGNYLYFIGNNGNISDLQFMQILRTFHF